MNRVRGLRAAVSAMLHDRRPRRFDATPDEVEQLRAAALLRAGRPGADLPRQQFVDALGDRLRHQVGATETERPRLPARRAFLRGAGFAAAAVAAGVGVDRAVIELRERGGPRSAGELVPDEGSWTAVATLEAVRATQALRFSHGAIEGVLVNRQDGGVDAISAVCTHLGCLLNVDAPRRLLSCPCHKASFALDGTPVDLEYLTTPLPWLRSRVRNGQVEVLVT